MSNSETLVPRGPSPCPGLAGKHLIFTLAGDTYGLPILQIQEISGWLPIDRARQTATGRRDVVDLRGRATPIIDLRQRLGLPPQQDTEHMCVVVVQAQNGDEPAVAGLLVDAVSEVLVIDEDRIQRAPAHGRSAAASPIAAIARLGQRSIALVAVDAVLSCDPGAEMDSPALR